VSQALRICRFAISVIHRVSHMFPLVRPFALICEAVLISSFQGKKSRRLMLKAIKMATSLGLTYPVALAQLELALLFPDSEAHRVKNAAQLFVAMRVSLHLRVLRETSDTTPELQEYRAMFELPPLPD
jgi:hypothetical protein